MSPKVAPIDSLRPNIHRGAFILSLKNLDTPSPNVVKLVETPLTIPEKASVIPPVNYIVPSPRLVTNLDTLFNKIVLGEPAGIWCLT